MGQKVHPYGYRLGVIKTWQSNWYGSKNYADLLKHDKKIRSYIYDKFKAASISRVEIERAAKNIKINIYSSRPGIIIGKKVLVLSH